MLKMPELRDKMKNCLQEKSEFSTADLKEWLAESGYVYNIDYNIKSFSNAVSSLTKQKYIVSLDLDRRGKYRVAHESETLYKNDKDKEKSKERYLDRELELKDMRNKIVDLLKKTGRDIEDMLDTEKLSTYRKSPKTYGDILKLLEYLENFEFTIDK